jgi:hypothetical protein
MGGKLEKRLAWKLAQKLARKGRRRVALAGPAELVCFPRTRSRSISIGYANGVFNCKLNNMSESSIGTVQ